MTVYDIDKNNPSLEGCMATVSGRIVNLMDPNPDDFILSDIAHGLSNCFRWNGHTAIGYSVAEHSVRVYEKASERAKPYALFHDAEEAYWGDMIRPLKMVLKKEKSSLIGKMLDTRLAIMAKFGIEYDDEILREVKAIDDEEMNREFEQSFLSKYFEPLPPQKAYGIWFDAVALTVSVPIL